MKVFPTPESLKQFLGLSRIGKIDVFKHLPLVEEQLKIKIRVLGETCYSSEYVSLKEIVLNSNDGHLEVDTKSINYSYGVSEEEKPIAVFRKDKNDKNIVHYYNGTNHFTTSSKKFIQWRKNMRYTGYSEETKSSHYMLVEYVGKFFKNHELIKKKMEQFYDKYVKDATELKELTGDKYNLFRCGTIKNCIVDRFYQLNKVLKADAIDQDEAEWLSKMYLSGLIWAKKGYQGKAHKYDYVSHYTSIMRQQTFRYPIKKGIFKKITDEQLQNMPFFEYGIYRVKIEHVDFKLLRISNGYATHFDLKRAKELGYTIKIVEDGKPNLLSYAGKGMTSDGRDFKRIVDELFEYKKKYGKTHEIFKKLLNRLWGSLCQKRKNEKYVKKDEEYDVPYDEDLVDIIMHDGYDIIETKNKKLEYQTAFARLGPFLTSKSRAIMSSLIEKHYNDVVRVYIDGILTKNKIEVEHKDNRSIENKGIGDDIGCLRYEGYNPSIFIHNPSRIDGLHEFKI